MTQIDENKYPAHAKVANLDDFSLMTVADDYVCHTNGLTREFTQLLAEHEALLNSVVLLGDDAEPEVGDLLNDGNEVVSSYVMSTMRDPHITLDDLRRFNSKVTIAQRNGKPVIYKSTLNTVKENGE